MTRSRPPSVRIARRRVAESFVTTVLILAATAIAATAFWPIYRSRQLVVLVIVTILVGAAIAILGRVLRLPAYLVAIIGTVAYLVFGVPLAVPDRALAGWLPSVNGVLDLLAGTALSFTQLLTVSLPAGSFRALLVPAFLIVLVTVIVSVSITLRARRPEVATLGPILVLVSAIALGPTGGFASIPISLALLSVLLTFLAVERRFRRAPLIANTAPGGQRPRRGYPSRTFTAFLGGLVLTAVATGGAAAMSGVVSPGGPRAVLRSAVVHPFDPRDYPSPLSGFRSYLQGAAAASPMLTVRGLPDGARIRIATLDSYDGVVYSAGDSSGSSGTFTLVPFRLDHPLSDGRPITLGITVGDYSGVWVPTVGDLSSVTFSGVRSTVLNDGLYYNDSTKTAADIRELRAGDSYTIDAVLPAVPPADAVDRLEPGSAVVPPAQVIPSGLEASLAGFVGQTSGAGARLQAVLAGLRATGYLSHGIGATEPASRSGHSADRITRLLTRNQIIGDDEQYAVAGALMARQLGFPARVVFGFRPASTRAAVNPAVPNPAESTPAASTGSTVLTGSDISAWLEVNTAAYGWVAFDATPPARDIPAGSPETPTLVTRPEAPVPPPDVAPADPAAQVPQSTAPVPPTPRDPTLATVLAILSAVGWSLAGGALVLAPFAAVLLVKAHRRRRRRQGPALRRITGTWQNFEDSVIDHGIAVPVSPTRREFALAVGGVEPARVAEAVDRAVFAPDVPGAREADRMRAEVVALLAALDAGLSRRERLRSRLSLRSLRRS